MKVVELRAERAKIYDLFDNNNHYYSSTDNRGDGGIFAKVQKETEKVLKKTMRMIKPYWRDWIKSITFLWSQMLTHILMYMENIWSIATARMYLTELGTEHYFKGAVYVCCDSIFDTCMSTHNNLQADFYDRCWVGRNEEVILDPMHLKEKKAEYRVKETHGDMICLLKY